jgi:hypothetical protein
VKHGVQSAALLENERYEAEPDYQNSSQDEQESELIRSEMNHGIDHEENQEAHEHPDSLVNTQNLHSEAHCARQLHFRFILGHFSSAPPQNL